MFPQIVDDIYVSTDYENIKKVAIEFSAKIIDHPNELANDHTPTLPVLLDVLKQLNDPEIKNVIILHATNPLRGHTLLSDAWEVYT